MEEFEYEGLIKVIETFFSRNSVNEKKEIRIILW